MECNFMSKKDKLALNLKKQIAYEDFISSDLWDLNVKHLSRLVDNSICYLNDNYLKTGEKVHFDFVYYRDRMMPDHDFWKKHDIKYFSDLRRDVEFLISSHYVDCLRSMGYIVYQFSYYKIYVLNNKKNMKFVYWDLFTEIFGSTKFLMFFLPFCLGFLLVILSYFQ